MRNTVVCLTQSPLSSQSNPKTQLCALGELGVRQLGIGIGIGNISTLATFTSVWVFELVSWSWRVELELESGIEDLRILCGKFLTATSEVVSNMLFPVI
jgi:hypothetical protein